MKRNVLVTGSAGRIGRAAVAALASAGHTVVGFDRVPTPGLDPAWCVVGDLGDAAAVLAAVRRAEVVVHLAAAPDDTPYPPGDGDNFLSELVPANVVGLYNVLDAARRAGTARLVLASSVQVVDELITEDAAAAIRTDAPPRPRYLYACTKVLLEALGRVYAAHHGLDVLAVRLGWCPRPGQEQEFAAHEFHKNLYLSPRDVGEFVVAAAEAPLTPGAFHVVYALSRPLRPDAAPLFDMAPTRELLGWEPRDVWPAGM